MLSNRHPEDLDPDRAANEQGQIEIEVELQALRNGLLAAHDYAEAKTKEGIEARTAFNALEQEYAKLLHKSGDELLHWKLASFLLLLLVMALILALAVTNL